MGLHTREEMGVHLHCRAQFSTSGTSSPKLLRNYSDPTDDFKEIGDLGLSRLDPQDSCSTRKRTEPGETLIWSHARPGRSQKSPARRPECPKRFRGHSQSVSLVPPQVPRQSAGPAARTTHVSSKCCSRVASIPPAIRPGPRPRSKTLPASPKASVT